MLSGFFGDTPAVYGPRPIDLLNSFPSSAATGAAAQSFLAAVRVVVSVF